jgi:serine/threonine-protein kinase
VYALGVLAFQLLAGRLPYEGSITEIATKHLLDAPPTPSEFRRSIPPAADAAILRALAKEPRQRPAVGAFAAELRSAFGRTRSSAAPPNDESSGERQSRAG